MKLHPETKVTVDVIADNNSYTTKMQTILSSTDGSNTPDIIHSNFFGDVVGGAAAARNRAICSTCLRSWTWSIRIRMGLFVKCMMRSF